MLQQISPTKKGHIRLVSSRCLLPVKKCLMLITIILIRSTHPITKMLKIRKNKSRIFVTFCLIQSAVCCLVVYILFKMFFISRNKKLNVVMYWSAINLLLKNVQKVECCYILFRFDPPFVVVLLFKMFYVGECSWM